MTNDSPSKNKTKGTSDGGDPSRTQSIKDLIKKIRLKGEYWFEKVLFGPAQTSQDEAGCFLSDAEALELYNLIDVLSNGNAENFFGGHETTKDLKEDLLVSAGAKIFRAAGHEQQLPKGLRGETK